MNSLMIGPTLRPSYDFFVSTIRRKGMHIYTPTIRSSILKVTWINQAEGGKRIAYMKHDVLVFVKLAVAVKVPLVISHRCVLTLRSEQITPLKIAPAAFSD